MLRVRQCRACSETAKQGESFCEKHLASRAEQEKLARANHPWAAWYSRTHWLRLRTLVLARDPICKVCDREASVVTDHIIPHRGDWFLFCGGVNMENLQGLCVKCHNDKSARELAEYGSVVRSF